MAPPQHGALRWAPHVVWGRTRATEGHVRRHNCMHILVAIILRGVLAAVLCFVCSDPVTMAEHYTAAPPTPSILHSGPVSVVHSSFQAGPRNDCQEPYLGAVECPSDLCSCSRGDPRQSCSPPPDWTFRTASAPARRPSHSPTARNPGGGIAREGASAR